MGLDLSSGVKLYLTADAYALFQFIVLLDPKTLPAECQSEWPHTESCLIFISVLD